MFHDHQLTTANILCSKVQRVTDTADKIIADISYSEISNQIKVTDLYIRLRKDSEQFFKWMTEYWALHSEKAFGDLRKNTMELRLEQMKSLVSQHLN